MKILITNNTLQNLGGSEWVVIELARALVARGHQVVACSSQIGEAGRLIKESGITVINNPFDTPFQPDVIHGQHHLDTMRAIAAFPNTPAIYHYHGYFPWVEDAPFHPRITHYLGMCELLTEKLRVNADTGSAQILTFNNWFDDTRFKYPRVSQKTPKKALFYFRAFNRQSSIAQKLVEIFKLNGIELDLNVEGNSTPEPELVLNEYDIVLASGRSAIEAMASGCAVIPVSDKACLDFVNLQNFEEFQKQNFSPLSFTPNFNIQNINDILQQYNVNDVQLVTKKIRQENNLSNRVIEFENIYLDSIQRFKQKIINESIDSHVELLAFSKYIQTIMPLVREYEKLKYENLEIFNLKLENEELHALKLENQQFRKLSEINQDLQHRNILLTNELNRVNQSFSMRLTKPMRKLNQFRLKLKNIYS